MHSVEHFPYTARRRWHIDVAQFNTTVESVEDGVDDRRRRADSAGLARALNARWVGRRRHQENQGGGLGDHLEGELARALIWRRRAS